VQALIDHAKANPAKLNYASPGLGTPQHLAMELFKQTAKVDIVHVDFPTLERTPRPSTCWPVSKPGAAGWMSSTA
jgi:hypothetical protein